MRPRPTPTVLIPNIEGEYKLIRNPLTFISPNLNPSLPALRLFAGCDAIKLLSQPNLTLTHSAATPAQEAQP